VNSRAGLDYMEKLKFLILPGLEFQPLDRQSCIQSLYRLSYRGSSLLTQLFIINYLEGFRPDRQQEKTKHAHMEIEIKENATRTNTN
jgi:hypothetical protein